MNDDAELLLSCDSDPSGAASKLSVVTGINRAGASLGACKDNAIKSGLNRQRGAEQTPLRSAN